MRAFVLAIATLIALSAAARAQSQAQSAAPTTGTVLSPLPSPDLAAGDRPSDYLRAAQGALTAGHNREAQQALEMAQTRMLDRAVPMGETNDPSDNPTVGQISQALQALAARDRATCMQAIQTAIGSATAQGL